MRVVDLRRSSGGLATDFTPGRPRQRRRQAGTSGRSDEPALFRQLHLSAALADAGRGRQQAGHIKIGFAFRVHQANSCRVAGVGVIGVQDLLRVG
jgi:hypothetical protein